MVSSHLPARAIIGALTSALVVVCGCSSSDGTTAPRDGAGETYLGLETPPGGFLVKNVGTTIAAGGDEEYCEVAELPGKPEDTFYANRIELANGDASHHLIVLVAPPGGKADRKLRSMEIGDRVPCVAAQMVFGEDLESVGGIQRPRGELDYPDGIAREFHGNQRVVFDYHYFNASQKPVQASSAFTMALTKKSEVKQLAGGFGFVNWTIDTPPGEEGAFRADCRFQKDAIVPGLARHTHRWGSDFSVWYAGGDRDGEHIWTSPDYEHDIAHAFDEPELVRAGQGYQFECDYTNTETYALRFGTAAKDEMCILAGAMWSADGSYDPPQEVCDVTYVKDDSVGVSATDPAAFPPSSEANAQACLAGAGANPSACTECSCTRCADILIKCFTDPDCGPIAQCQPPTDCTSVIDEHSSGVGLSRQVGECIVNRCKDECAPAGG